MMARPALSASGFNQPTTEKVHMGLLNRTQPARPAAKLMEQASALQVEVRQAEEDALQAEAAAVAAAADPDAYQGAAVLASRTQAALAELRARLKRLEQAAAAAAGVEQEAYVARLREHLETVKTTRGQVVTQAAADRTAEEQRHSAALADIERRELQARAAVASAETSLRKAENGMTEAAIDHVAALRKNLDEIRDRFGGDALDPQCNEATGLVFSTKAQLRSLEASRSIGPGVIADVRAELAKAEKHEVELSERRRQRNAESAAVQAEIDRLESRKN